MSTTELTGEIAVIGAGPGGLAAAVAAADAGADVVLLDAGAELGGQFWRHPPESVGADRVSPAEIAAQHHDLHRYRDLRERVRAHETAGRLRVMRGHHVWTIGAGFEIRALDESTRPATERVVRARTVVLAPGAYDRQLPFPGWDLPGVLTAGGAQALLKGSAVAPAGRVLVAGTGPFLLSVAAGLSRGGAEVVGVHEAASPRRWLRHSAAVLRNLGKLGEGAGYARTLARRRVSYRTSSTVVAAHGTDRLEAVTVARVRRDGGLRPGSERRVAVDTLAVGWGFTPQLELPLALGCTSRLDVDGSLVIEVDDDQRTNVAGAFVAGEACGVGGAALALVEGQIAGAAAAAELGHGDGPDASLRPARRRLRAFARAMHLAYPMPTGWVARLTDDTLVCRCEEVDVGRLRQVVHEFDLRDPRSAKLLARPGMGWCQGRVCGYATSCLVSQWSGAPYQPQQLAHRPLAGPVRLGLLAAEDKP